MPNTLIWISSVDRTNAIGKLVGEYGDNRYWLGFCHGIVASSIIVFTVVLLKLRK